MAFLASRARPPPSRGPNPGGARGRNAQTHLAGLPLPLPGRARASGARAEGPPGEARERRKRRTRRTRRAFVPSFSLSRARVSRVGGIARRTQRVARTRNSVNLARSRSREKGTDTRLLSLRFGHGEDVGGLERRRGGCALAADGGRALGAAKINHTHDHQGRGDHRVLPPPSRQRLHSERNRRESRERKGKKQGVCGGGG